MSGAIKDHGILGRWVTEQEQNVYHVENLTHIRVLESRLAAFYRGHCVQSEKWIEVNARVDIVFTVNQTVSDDTVDRYIAEMYDQHETRRDDVELIQSPIRDRTTKILELFYEHDRILILLAEVGYEIMEQDLSERLRRDSSEARRHTYRSTRLRSTTKASKVSA